MLRRKWSRNCGNNRFYSQKCKHHMRCLDSQLGVVLQTTPELTMCHTSKKPRSVFKPVFNTFSYLWHQFCLTFCDFLNVLNYVKIQLITAFNFRSGHSKECCDYQLCLFVSCLFMKDLRQYLKIHKIGYDSTH